jgi:transcriptional regulator GlxA family with amidase domain
MTAIITNTKNNDTTEKSKFSVAFLLLNDFTIFAFSGFIDALRLAGDDADNSQQKDCRWTIVAPNLKPIRANCGVEILPWEVFPDPRNFDYLVVVGGRVEPQRRLDHRIIRYLNRVAAHGNTIIGLCTASFVLARAGIMEGYKCCVHWYHRNEFEQEFPQIRVDSDTVYVEDNNRITCPGGRAAVDVALLLIERHCSAVTARKVVSAMVIEQMRGERSPQPHAESAWFGEISNPLVRRAIAVMDQKLTSMLSINEIATRLQVSENTLYRVFKQACAVSPAKLFRAMRLAHAHWALKKSSLSISEIAHYFRFSDASHFTRLHRKYYGMSPSAVRAMSTLDYSQLRLSSGFEEVIQQILFGGLFIISKDEQDFA